MSGLGESRSYGFNLLLLLLLLLLCQEAVYYKGNE
jgi:hypothetical protein